MKVIIDNVVRRATAALLAATVGINSYPQDVVRGAIVLGAVLLSSLRNRRQSA